MVVRLGDPLGFYVVSEQKLRSVVGLSAGEQRLEGRTLQRQWTICPGKAVHLRFVKLLHQMLDDPNPVFTAGS